MPKMGREKLLSRSNSHFYSDKQNRKHGEMGACIYLNSEFLEVSLIFHISNDLKFSVSYASMSLQGTMRDIYRKSIIAIMK